MSSSYRIALNNFLDNLELEGDLAFDVGGSQESLQKRVKKFNVKELIIIDLPEPHQDSPKPDIAWDMNDPINFSYGPARDIYSKTKEQADIVTAFELLDYIYDPLTAFKNMAFFLKKGGMLYISSGLVYPTHNPIQDDCLRYTEFGIKKLAEKTGLEVLEMLPRRPETNAIEVLWRSERLRAAKHYDHNTLGFITKLRKL